MEAGHYFTSSTHRSHHPAVVTWLISETPTLYRGNCFLSLRSWSPTPHLFFPLLPSCCSQPTAVGVMWIPPCERQSGRCLSLKPALPLMSLWHPVTWPKLCHIPSPCRCQDASTLEHPRPRNFSSPKTGQVWIVPTPLMGVSSHLALLLPSPPSRASVLSSSMPCFSFLTGTLQGHCAGTVLRE